MSEPNLELPIEGLLMAVSQIGLALGGFAGLLASFWPSQHSRALRRSPALRIVLDFSFAALAFGLVPFAAYYLTGSQIAAWKTCSVLLAAFLIWQLTLWTTRIRRGLRILHPRMFYGIFVLPNVIVAVVEFLNAFTRSPLRLYTVGLLWLLVPPVIQLYLFIVDQDTYLRAIPRRIRKRKGAREESGKAA